MISKENEIIFSLRKQVDELGITCAMNYDKLSPAEQRIMLDFFRAMKHIEKVNNGGKVEVEE